MSCKEAQDVVEDGDVGSGAEAKEAAGLARQASSQDSDDPASEKKFGGLTTEPAPPKDFNGWTRQISPADSEDAFSEYNTGFSRMCTDASDCARPQASLKHVQRVEVQLAVNPSVTSTVMMYSQEAAGALRRTVSEATGVAINDVKLLVSSSGIAVEDHELIPLMVTVSGVLQLPRGGVLLGRAQFLEVLEKLRDAMANERINREFTADSTEDNMLFDVMLPSVWQQVMQQELTISAADLKAFYHSSEFCNELEFQRIFAEINSMCGNSESEAQSFLLGA